MSSSLAQLTQLIEAFRAKIPSKIIDTEARFNALVVDPDEEPRHQLKALLEGLSYTVFTAPDLKKAQTLLDSIRNLSLVVCVPRPQGDEPLGVQFLTRLKNSAPSIIPILSVSFTESEDAVGALRNNIQGIFIKPYDDKEVKSTLSDLLYLHNRHHFVANLINTFFSDYDRWKQKAQERE